LNNKEKETARSANSEPLNSRQKDSPQATQPPKGVKQEERHEFNENDIRHAISVLKAPREVFEIRALDAKLDGGYKTSPVSGYFDHVDSCLKELQRLFVARDDYKTPKGIYITLNAIDPALLARRVNRLDYSKTTTSDTNVIRRKWLLIDTDPVRPSDISASDPEKQAARELAREIYRALKDRNWPEPVIGDSGNGWHLLYRVDLSAQDDKLIERVVNGIADEFASEEVDIDRTVFNPARITKLYGTLAAKGDNTKERPHRLSRVHKVPGELTPVSEAQLRALADEWAPVQSAPVPVTGGNRQTPFDMESFLSRVGVRWKQRDTEAGGATKWVLEKCPFCENGAKDAAVFLLSDGTRGFKCFHNSCVDVRWKEFRANVDPGYSRKTFGVSSSRPYAVLSKPLKDGPPVSAHASPPVQPRPLGELLDAVSGILCRYVVFPSQEQASVVALWVAHTWTVDAFDFTPYLHVFSTEKRSGKSRLLDVLELLVKAPWRDAGATEAVLFRKIERDKPTLLSDEIDTVFHSKKNDGMENIRRMFNLGFTRGNKVSRCVGQNTSFDIQEFDPFCPKVLCGIGRCLPDTVADRALAIELVRQSTEEKAERFRARDARELVAGVRAELQAWAEQPGLIDKLNAARPQAPAEIRDRQEEICEPLIAIADLAGGTWPEIGRAALVGLCVQEEDASTGVKLLGDIKHVFYEAGTDRLTTRSVIEGLAAIEDDRPWALWFEDALRNDKLKAAAARLARRLKGFKVKPCKIRLGDETAQGYYRADFQNAWKRYLAAADPPSRINGTNGTDHQFTSENHVPTFVPSTRNVPTSVSTTRDTLYEGETQNVPSVPSKIEGSWDAIIAANNGEHEEVEDPLIGEAISLFNATNATAA
jgi:uncharacterized protein DUF3631